MPISVLQYNFKMYIKSYKYIMPFFVFIIYTGVAYYITPVTIIGSMTSSATFIFALMTWIGFTYYNKVDLVAEEVLILKLKSHTRYWISKIIFMSVVGLFFSILSIGIPLAYNLVYNVFKNPITFSDIVVSFFLYARA